MNRKRVAMVHYAFVTGADRGLGLALSARLLEQGWQVFAGQYIADWPELSILAQKHPGRLQIIPIDVGDMLSVQDAAQLVGKETDRIDLLINNAGVNSATSRYTIREPQDYAEMQRLYNTNALGPLRVVEAFLHLTDKSEFKRLCIVSSEAGSIERSYRNSWFGYCMSKAAVNMAARNLFNDLRPLGYSFRLYHPGWIRSYMSGVKNTEATLEPEEAAEAALGYFLQERDDEDTLVLRDWEGKDWPW